MRKQIIAGNWKLNKTVAESKALASSLAKESFADNSPEVLIFPVFTSLAAVVEACQGSKVQVGAQDLYWEESGAYTGQVSGSLIKDTGATHVLIGHSERRQFFGETEETVNKKILAANNNGLIPVVCVGELLADRESGNTENILNTQVKGAFNGIDSSIASQCVIAYEPVWAIGTGKVASPEQAQEAHAHIRKLVLELYSEDQAQDTSILYGGSVKPGNAGELMKQGDVDGALVGGASLDAESFSQIIRASAEIKV